jgi:hypothetical protein
MEYKILLVRPFDAMLVVPCTFMRELLIFHKSWSFFIRHDPSPFSICPKAFLNVALVSFIQSHVPQPQQITMPSCSEVQLARSRSSSDLAHMSVRPAIEVLKLVANPIVKCILHSFLFPSSCLVLLETIDVDLPLMPSYLK